MSDDYPHIQDLIRFLGTAIKKEEVKPVNAIIDELTPTQENEEMSDQEFAEKIKPYLDMIPGLIEQAKTSSMAAMRLVALLRIDIEFNGDDDAVLSTTNALPDYKNGDYDSDDLGDIEAKLRMSIVQTAESTMGYLGEYLD